MNQSIPAIAYEVSQVMPMAVATGLFISRCTFQVPDGVLGPSGAPSGAYIDVPGHVDIVCMDAPQPPSEIKLGATEDRQSSQITDTAPRHVLLDSYYPTVMEEWREGMRAIVDGTIYDVAGAECDSQRTQVRLELKLISAGDYEAFGTSGVVMAVNFEGSGTGFIVGIAETLTITGSGLGLSINILTVQGDQILTYEIGNGGTGYTLNDSGQILPNGGLGGDPEDYLVTEVS